MNRVFLKGNLTRDPEIREIPLGEKTATVANFTLAVSRYYKKQNGETEQATEYLDCEAWDSGAVTIGKILSKGDPVLIEGSLKKETWEDKESGQKRSRVKIRVSTFDKLARYTKNEDTSITEDDHGSSPTNELPSGEPVGAGVGDEHGNGDDIPF